MKDRATSYKKKSTIVGVEKRSIRAHDQSVDQKKKREDEVSKRRKIKKEPLIKEQSKSLSAKEIAAANRKEKLMKWKEEKELQKKLQDKEKVKKPQFRVKRVEYIEKADKIYENKKRAKQPAKPEEKPAPTRRVTRSSAAAAAGNKKVETQKKPKDTKRKNTKEEKRNKNKVETEPEPMIVDDKPVSEQIENFVEKAGKITTKRGEPSGDSSSAESFAPADFTFTAPANLASFVFNPISPRSSAEFLCPSKPEAVLKHIASPQPRRCSTPRHFAKEDRSDQPMSLPANLEGGFAPASFYKASVSTDSSASDDENVKNKIKHITSLVKKINTTSTVIEQSRPQKDVEGGLDFATSCRTPRGSSRRASVRTPGLKKVQIDSESKANDSSKKKRRSVAPKMPKNISTDDESEVPKSDDVPKRTPRNRRSTAKVSNDTDAETSKDDVFEENQSPTLPKKTPRRKSIKTPAAEKAKINDNVENDENVPETSDNLANFSAIDNKVDGTNNKKLTRRSIATTHENVRPLVEDTFKTPNPLSRSLKKRRRTVASVLSPEERAIQILSKSPMIELDRRTPKRKSPVAPVFQPDFSDIDDILSSPPPVFSLDCDETDISPVPSIPSPVQTDISEEYHSAESGIEKKTSEQSLDDAHDVKYFRNLLSSETKRLCSLGDQWTEINNMTQDLSEEVSGQIRTTVGQAHLLMNQRFKQFRGLVDNCEYKTGEKETNCEDLQGFWDMVYFQVEDVDVKFEELEKLRDSGWVTEKPKSVKKKKIVKKVSNKAASNAKSAKSKFADFKRQMLANRAKQGKAGEFLSLNSPKGGVRSSPRLSAPSYTVSTPEGTTAAPEPLIKSVLEKNARRSIVKTPLQNLTPSLRRSVRKSLAKVASPLAVLSPRDKRRSASPRVDLKISPQLSTSRSSSITPIMGSLSLDDVGMKAATPVIPKSSTKAASSKRKSLRDTPKNRSVSFAASPVANNDASFMKYLLPTAPMDHPEKIMEVDSPICDAEMPAQMKKNLCIEFDDSGRRVATSAMKKTQGSSRKRNSVRFNKEDVSPVHGMAEKLPVTPFNTDSLVPKKRRSCRSSVEPSCVSFTASPASPLLNGKYQNLQVDYSPSKGDRRVSLLFTPEESAKQSPLVSIDNLMCFTPDAENGKKTASKSTVTPRRKSIATVTPRRKSVRLLSEEKLIDI